MTQRIPLQDLTSDAAVEHHSPQAKTTGRSPPTSGHIYVREIQGFFQRIRRYSNWLLIALVTGVTFVGYVTPVGGLVRDLFSLEAHPWALFWIGFFTLFTYLNAGWLRHQVCLHMCPYARFQSAMFDSHTLIVSYDSARGEPRRGHRKEVAEAAAGDCIDCELCVQVCPTGIDIREGPQIGCITCALCIDACDRVMKDIGRPRGLIDYATLEDCEREAAGGEPKAPWRTLLRPRTIAYFLIWGGIGGALLFALGVRSHTELTVAPDRNPPFMLLSDGSVRNSYTLKLRNMESRPRDMEIAIEGLPGAVMWTDTIRASDAAATQTVTVPADLVRQVRAYVAVPEGARSQEFAFRVTSLDEQRETDTVETRFDAPED